MAGILDLNARDFTAALAELQLDPQREAELRREYRRQNSLFSPIYGLIDRVRQGDEAEGRVRADVVPMTRPQGMTGLEAIMSGEAEFAVPNILLGAPEAVGMAVDAPAAAYQGAIPAEDMVGEALNTAGLLALGGQAIPAPAGSMRIFAGRNSRTADLEALARAQELSARRRSPEEIWNETGWFKGVDDQWRYEIPDDLLTIDPNMRNPGSEGVRNDPYSLIRHQRLANAYPDATDRLRIFALPAEQMPKPTVAGLYNRGLLPEIHLRDDINLSLRGAPTRDVERMAEVAGHELQHFVQEQEGFARGGAPLRSPQATTLTDSLLFGRAMEGALARNDVPRLELMRADRPETFDTWLNALNEYPRSSASEISEFVNEMTNPNITGGFPRENYRLFAGEVEAETVANRLRLTPEERAARPPWLDEPVPRDQQIIREKNLGYNLPDQNLLTANLRGLLSR